MKVLKFGGTSVANAENIKKVMAIVQQEPADSKPVVIVSALGGTTDALLQCGRAASSGDEAYRQLVSNIHTRHLEAIQQLVGNDNALNATITSLCEEIAAICNGVFLLSELSTRTTDKLMSYGELMSSLIIAAAFEKNGIATKWLDSRSLIVTNDHFGNAAVDAVTTNNNIRWAVSASEGVTIAPGFIASTANGITTTLGRGGSDYTAAIFAAALDAAVLEIWTDVSGMMTADPRFVANAKIIDSISYQDAMELSHFGAKVIYPPTIQPVLSKNIPVCIKNTFAPADPGTLIQHKADGAGSAMIKGISSINQIALLSLEGTGMVGVPGFSKRLFEALANDNINVILITQGSSEHSICVGIHDKDAVHAKNVIDKTFEQEIQSQKLQPLVVEKDLSIIALVGEQMKRHTGVSGRMFEALGRNGINIRAIAQGSSERNISAVIDTRDVRKAVNVLHEAFFESSNKKIHIFIAGAGNVGSRLLHQLQQQKDYLSKKLHLDITLAGLANSKQFIIQEEGIDIANWKEVLSGAPQGNIEQFSKEIIQRNLRNSLFVDITANDAVAKVYASLLKKSVSVIACNKLAASSPYTNYKELKDLAGEFNASFLFETNVGAGLPVIGTLNDLTRSGDSVHRIEAVLSGTLNFVFNNYDGSRNFAAVVKQAQEEGYTEPDPRLDLNGSDVMRKILILAREAGVVMEFDEIGNRSFLPESCLQGSVADFYVELEKHEAHFRKLYDEAAASNCKLKFVASFENGKAAVGLQHISPEHNLYHLYGKDNIVLFYTDRYSDQPMVIKGAGAGADVTASGVFADIVRAARI